MLHLKLSTFTVTLQYSPELLFPASSERLCADSVLKQAARGVAQAAVLLTSQGETWARAPFLTRARTPVPVLVKSFHAANLLTGKEMPDEDKVSLGE